MDPDADQDPTISSLTFKTPTLIFFDGTFTSFFKDKKS
jgi:hypothetical protein